MATAAEDVAAAIKAVHDADRRGDRAAAIALAAALRSRFPAEPTGYRIGAKNLRISGRLDEAEALARAGMQLSPDKSWPLVEMAWTEAARGRRAEAIRWAGDIRARFPAEQSGYRVASAMLRLEGKLDEAAAFARDALARFPGEAWPWTDAAALAQARGEWDEADGLWAEVRTRFPAEPAAYVGGAAMHSRHFRLDAAEAMLLDAIARFPGHRDVLKALAETHEKRGKLDVAAKRYGELRDRYPDLLAAHLGLAEALARMGKRAEAEAACREAMTRLPEAGAPHATFVTLAMKGGDPGTALARSLAAHRLFPRDPQWQQRAETARRAVAAQIIERRRASWQGRPARALARTMGPALRRAALRSRTLWRHWSTAPGGFASRLRRAVVAEIVRRNEYARPLEICLATGDRVIADPSRDLVIARQFLLAGHYEAGLTRWICRRLKPGQTFIDVGTCYGHIALAASRAVGPAGSVIAIDASAARIEALARAIEHNRCGNLKSVWVAVGSHTGVARFALYSSNPGASRLAWRGISETGDEALALLDGLTVVDLEAPDRPRMLTDAERREARVVLVEVPMRTLDDLAADTGRPIDLIKMDIEGAELEALRGATRLLDGAFGPPPTITLEYSTLFPTFGGRRDEIFALFAARGWTAWRFEKGKARGGRLVQIASDTAAPAHDDLVFAPPGKSPADDA